LNEVIFSIIYFDITYLKIRLQDISDVCITGRKTENAKREYFPNLVPHELSLKRIAKVLL